MSETKNVISVKTEYISNEEEDIDCFGNFDHREVNTCQKCGLKNECSVATKAIQEQKLSFRRAFKNSIQEGQLKIKESQDVIQLVSKIKNKQQEQEKTIMEKVKKLKPKKKKIEEVATEEVVVTKKVKKIDKSEKTESSSDKPKKSLRDSIEVIGDTTIPIAFKSLYKGLKELGPIKSKTSITNVMIEGKGILVCVPLSGRTEKKVVLFINASKGYEMSSGKNTEVKPSKKGELLLTVQAEDASIQEALTKLTKWKKDRAGHIESMKQNKSSKPKKEKSSSGEEVEKVKVFKKKKKHSEEEVKSEVSGEKKKKFKKKVKSSEDKSSAPITAKPSADDDEDDEG